MLSRAANDGFPALSPPAINALKGKNGSELFEGLKAAIDLAVHISPLTLLNPVAFKHWSMDRQRLIEVRRTCLITGRTNIDIFPFQWAHGLGPKPLYILAAENQLWQAIVSIAVGTDCRAGLRAFLEGAGDSMDESAADESLVEAFFINGYLKNEEVPGQTALAIEDIQDAGDRQAEDGSGVIGNDVTMQEPNEEGTMAPQGSQSVLPDTPGFLHPVPEDPSADAFGFTPDHPASPRASPTPPRTVDGLPTPCLSDLDDLTESEGDGGEGDVKVGVRGRKGKFLDSDDEVRRASSRQPKPPAIFTSGAHLTVGPPPKKRKRRSTKRRIREDTPAKIKEEDRYWETTEEYWNKAVRISALDRYVNVSSIFIYHAACGGHKRHFATTWAGF